MKVSRITSAAALTTNQVKIYGYEFYAGTATSGMTIKDSATATTNTTTYMFQAKASTNSAKSLILNNGIIMKNGAYVTISGSGAIGYIYYE